MPAIGTQAAYICTIIYKGMSKIKINIATKQWTEGEHVGLTLKIREGRKATIDWGDGKSESTIDAAYAISIPADSETRDAGEGWVHYGHRYKEKGAAYSIVISSDGDDAIEGFQGSGFYEVHTDSVDVSECPEIEEFGHSGDPDMTSHIDLSHNTRLRSVWLRGLGCTDFDVSPCKELEAFEINECPNITSVNLTKNDAVRKLTVTYCNSLRRISVSNRSALDRVTLTLTEIDANSLTYLKRVVRGNGGRFEVEE